MMGAELHVTAVVFTLLGLSLGAGILWWIIRRRQERLWLPTIRILHLPKQTLPQLTWTWPPWLAFLCFMIAALGLAALALRPLQKISMPANSENWRAHIIVDLSPSVSAHANIFQLKAATQKIWAEMRALGRVTIGTTWEPTVFEPKDAEEAGEFVSSKGFHRAGVRLSHAVRAQLNDVGRVNRLVVLGDRDENAWSGFNWQYLTPETGVYLVAVQSSNGDVQNKNAATLPATGVKTPVVDGTEDHTLGAENIYVNNVTSGDAQEYNVEIARSSLKTDKASARDALRTSREGLLHVKDLHSGRELRAVSWRMPAGRSHVLVEVSLAQDKPSDKADSGLDAAPPVPGSEVLHEKTASDFPDFLAWNLEISGGDAIAADNIFYSTRVAAQGQVTVIGAPSGERQLSDPAWHLETVFRVFGFHVRRLDHVATAPQPSDDDALTVVFGGRGEGEEEFCPTAHGSGPVWLIPASMDADFRELCRCFARLTGKEKSGAGSAQFCENVTSRDNWIGVLGSLGASQLGGGVSEARSSLAYFIKPTPADDENAEQGSSRVVLAMTVPLNADRSSLTHADLPMVVRGLLEWQGLRLKSTSAKNTAKDAASSPANGDVPTRLRASPQRVNDLAQDWQIDDSTNADSKSKTVANPPPHKADVRFSYETVRTKLQYANVPLPESSLQEAEKDNLPPQMEAIVANTTDTSSGENVELHVASKTDPSRGEGMLQGATDTRQETWRFIRYLLAIVFAAQMAEAIFNLILSIRRRVQGKANA